MNTFDISQGDSFGVELQQQTTPYWPGKSIEPVSSTQNEGKTTEGTTEGINAVL